MWMVGGALAGGSGLPHTDGAGTRRAIEHREADAIAGP